MLRGLLIVNEDSQMAGVIRTKVNWDTPPFTLRSDRDCSSFILCLKDGSAAGLPFRDMINVAKICEVF